MLCFFVEPYTEHDPFFKNFYFLLAFGEHSDFRNMDTLGYIKILMTSKQLPLTEFPAGTEAYIEDLTGGKSFRSKALSLGLNIKAKIKIEKTTSSQNGCIIIIVNNDSKLAIGRGMAEKIVVSSNCVKK